MLQIGRTLFREGIIEDAKRFFDAAAEHSPESAEAVACVGYTQHRLGEDDAAIATLRRALRLDGDHAEARVYLGNILYDRGDYEGALHHLDRSEPQDHWDELGIWRLIELKKTVYRLKDGDPELKPWEARLTELANEIDDIDEMLAEIEARVLEDSETEAKGQLELFGALLGTLADQRNPDGEHQITVDETNHFVGTWEEILLQMRDASSSFSGRTLQEFMTTEARRGYSLTGVRISTTDPESFIRGSASAGLLRIVR
jgi:tetratricopeptide (TPR) repeat protein